MTDNELIAEFMGGEIDLQTGSWQNLAQKVKHYALYSNDLKYDTSWGWLMPVVEKIYRLEDEDKRIAKFSLQNSRAVIKSGKKVFACHTVSPLNSTYRVVVEFIKWYNENKKP